MANLPIAPEKALTQFCILMMIPQPVGITDRIDSTGFITISEMPDLCLIT